MKHKEKLNYSCRRKTLKGRLQRSLTLSSFLSISILLLCIMILLFAVLKPIGSFFTDTVSNRIYKNYILSCEATDRFKRFDNGNNNLFNKSFDEILNAIDNRESIEEHWMGAQEIFDENNEVIIIYGNEITQKTITETEKKSILFSTKLALDEVNDILPIGESFGLNFVNVHFELNGEEVFKIPKEYDIHSKNIAEKKFGEIYSLIEVTNPSGEIIGHIRTSLNTGLISIILIPITLLFVLVAVMTFMLVKILLLPMTYRLLKPITALNEELKKIADEDHIECNRVKIEQKRPPTEVKELIDYSNTIINKLQDSFHLVEAHKDELEAQNEELDAQKDELEAQKDELEAQKEELQAQNLELMMAQEKIRNTQAQLVQSEKMASMGQLTAAIMHEINTPLGAIQSNNQIFVMMLDKLTKHLNENDEVAALKVIDKMRKSSGISSDAADRMSEIIRNLKNFSRVDQAEFQHVDIIDGLKSVMVLTSNLWKNKVSISEHYEDIPFISCFPSMINQVFMNVLVNAIQASDKGGHIDVNVSNDEEYVYILVKDQGKGIENSNMSLIFESGFTTKPKDEGTGLGLSISKDIVAKHDGKIEAYNNEDKGATFKITLPIKQNN